MPSWATPSRLTSSRSHQDSARPRLSSWSNHARRARRGKSASVWYWSADAAAQPAIGVVSPRTVGPVRAHCQRHRAWRRATARAGSPDRFAAGQGCLRGPQSHRAKAADQEALDHVPNKRGRGDRGRSVHPATPLRSSACWRSARSSRGGSLARRLRGILLRHTIQQLLHLLSRPLRIALRIESQRRATRESGVGDKFTASLPLKPHKWRRPLIPDKGVEPLGPLPSWSGWTGGGAHRRLGARSAMAGPAPKRRCTPPSRPTTPMDGLQRLRLCWGFRGQSPLTGSRAEPWPFHAVTHFAARHR